MSKLVVIEGGSKGESHPLTPKGLTIGRLPSSGLCLPDDKASRRHAKVERRGDAYYITDLGSSNGTKVNGRRVKDKRLSSGDVIAIGKHLLRFEDEDRTGTGLRVRLARHHSPGAVERILKEGRAAHDVPAGIVSEKEVTVLFAGIAGFMGMAERLAPSEAAALLNEYFTLMTDIVFEFGGTLDKYMGDSLMAVFGAPFSEGDDAVMAVRAALRMQAVLAGLMQDRKERERFGVRIGIDTGVAVAGNIGSPLRMEYTVIGGVVGAAQAIESAAKPGQVLVGESTYEKVKDRFMLIEVGSQKPKGRHKKEVAVYEALG